MTSDQTPIKKKVPWYNLLPWWGWIVAIIASSQLSAWLFKLLTGTPLEVIPVVFGCFMIYCFVALLVKLLVPIVRFIVKLLVRNKKPKAEDSNELLDLRK